MIKLILISLLIFLLIFLLIKFFKNINETAFIPRGSIHRIENIFKTPVKIMEVQTGTILKETDIIRYKDIYGRVN